MGYPKSQRTLPPSTVTPRNSETGQQELDTGLLQAALKANEQYGRTLAAFIDKSINLDLNVPPSEPVERSKWLEDYANMAQEVLDVTHAICTE